VPRPQLRRGRRREARGRERSRRRQRLHPHGPGRRRVSAQQGERLVLVVDDDDRFRDRLVRAFVDRGLDARGAASVEEARLLAAEESPEWAVVDLRMPGPSGLELLKELLAIDPATRVVVLTGYGSIATAIEAVRL